MDHLKSPLLTGYCRPLLQYSVMKGIIKFIVSFLIMAHIAQQNNTGQINNFLCPRISIS